MKILYLTIALALLVSCSKRPEPEAVELKDVEGSELKTTIQQSSVDSILYVNKINYFPRTNEFYVSLNFKKPFSDTIYDILSERTDSVIYDNGETSRNRLPMEIAKEAFDFSQLEELKVYTADYQFITNAKLKRAEYFVNLNGYFIAVFTPESVVPTNEENFYCLGTAKVDLKKISAQIIEDEKLTEAIKKQLNIHPQYVWKTQHIKIHPYNSIYACDQVNEGTISYLTEYKDNRINVLYKLKGEYAFYDFLPVPVEKDGRPVLLINITLPDSDAVDEYVVAVFNHSEYKLESNNRIKLK